jgi:hypothetical protein
MAPAASLNACNALLFADSTKTSSSETNCDNSSVEVAVIWAKILKYTKA